MAKIDGEFSSFEESFLHSIVPVDARQLRKHLRAHQIKSFRLIWLHFTSNDSDQHLQEDIARIRRICHSIEIDLFTDVDECIDCVTELNYDRIFMIISNQRETQLVRLIHEIPRLHSIYIYNNHMSENELSPNECTKMKGFFVGIDSICDSLERDIEQYEHYSMPVSILPSSDYSKKNLNELEPSFMYSKLLKEILANVEYKDNARKDLADFWREEYHENQSQLKLIDEFEQDYDKHTPIWWYTRDNFSYSILNQALRVLDSKIIIKMGFFLRDIHQQIERRYTENSASCSSLTVFRSQGLFKKDFKKLQASKGGLFAFNNFLSTSVLRDVALMFCPVPPPNPDVIPILFEMKIDSTTNTTPYTSLDDISAFAGQEREVLFSMHAVFRIGEIEPIENGIWHVKLEMTSDNDEQIQILTERLREETLGSTGWHRLGQLMIRIDVMAKAEEIYHMLIDSTTSSDEEQRVHLYSQLGHTKLKQGDFQQAFSLYNKTLEIQQRLLPSDHSSLARTYSNIGGVYYHLGDYSNSLKFHEQAIVIMEQSLPSNHLSLAITYNNMGELHRNLGNYTRSLEFYEKVLAIVEKTLPQNHPDLAVAYNNIAGLHFQQGDFASSLTIYLKTLEIQKKSLPSNHSSLETTYHNIAQVYIKTGDYPNSMLCCQKACDIFEKSLSSDHPALASAYNNIGDLYKNMGDYSNALLFCHKGLEIYKKSLPSNHVHLAMAYNNLGEVHRNLGDYVNALSLHRKALEIVEQFYPFDHFLLGNMHSTISMVYMLIEDNSTALLHCRKACEIFERFLPDHYFELGNIWKILGTLYSNMGEYFNALSFHKKAIEILKKSLSPEHPHIGAAYGELGTAYQKMEDYTNALLSYEQAHQIFKKSLPPNYIHLGMLYNNIGELYKSKDENERAFSYFEKALDIFERNFPHGHPQLATLCYSTAAVL